MHFSHHSYIAQIIVSITFIYYISLNRVFFVLSAFITVTECSLRDCWKSSVVDFSKNSQTWPLYLKLNYFAYRNFTVCIYVLQKNDSDFFLSRSLLYYFLSLILSFDLWINERISRSQLLWKEVYLNRYEKVPVGYQSSFVYVVQ